MFHRAHSAVSPRSQRNMDSILDKVKAVEDENTQLKNSFEVSKRSASGS